LTLIDMDLLRHFSGGVCVGNQLVAAHTAQNYACGLTGPQQDLPYTG
jgi:hypothetical protein